VLSALRKLSLIYKTLDELGPRQVLQYAIYQAGLSSGYWLWRTPVGGHTRNSESSLNLERLPLPEADTLLALLGENGRQELCSLADEICSGQVRLFGGPPVALRLAPPEPVRHWTAYGALLFNFDTKEYEDIKWIWEPARLGWGIQLGRAAYLTGDARYAIAFWKYVRQFNDANPPNLGPNWSSAQEIALRLISLCLAGRLCNAVQEPSPQEKALLSGLVANHAARIPLTLSYARAQNNNHLLSEAAGLYTAGIVLPEHPQAARWRELGWKWFNHGLQAQIAADGSYMQNSTNYHRLMLQLALWVNLLATSQGKKLPTATQDKLAISTQWLLALVVQDTGFVPNLGPNDGAYLFPLAPGGQVDYRPVLQAASAAFLGNRAYLSGAWDEMLHWFVPASVRLSEPAIKVSPSTNLLVLRPPDAPTWAYLRAAQFHDRPGHADQLHLDLWWRGWNIAADAGTYLYNSPPPWDNSLDRTAVHNTLMIENQEQMTRAGRFLWLDRAQAQVLDYQPKPVHGKLWAVAQHDGYRQLGLVHRRKVQWDGIGWQVEDEVLQQSAHPDKRESTVMLHWLLPDWPWEILEKSLPRLRLHAPSGWVELTLQGGVGLEMQPGDNRLQLVRAGVLLLGDGVAEPNWGWRSPTYGYKEPALAVRYRVQGALPLRLVTRWEFVHQIKTDNLSNAVLES